MWVRYLRHTFSPDILLFSMEMETIMRALKQAAALSVTALLLSHVQAAPKPPAPIDKIHTVCKITIRDSSGKEIGNRTTVDDSSGFMARARATAGLPSAGNLFGGLLSIYGKYGMPNT
jgi:hypothetical protein